MQFGGVSDVGSEVKALGLSVPICAITVIVSILWIPLGYFQGLGNQIACWILEHLF